MRIVTWNLLNGGQDGASTERLDRITGVLRGQNPDVVLLQEANGFAADNQRRLHHLENSLDMRGFLGVAKTGYDVATFVRRDQAVGSHEVDATNFFHAMVRVELLLDGVSLHVINTHLCPHSAQVRVTEAQHLARYVRYGATDDVHVVIGGDFNSLDPHQGHSAALEKMPPYYRARYLVPGDDQQPDTRVGRALEVAGLVDIGYLLGDQSYTIPTLLPVFGADFGRLRLDYMYLSPGFASLTTDYGVIRTEQTDKCSDHYPLMIDVGLPVRAHG